PEPRAVRRGGDRAGDLLRDDVALVRKREPRLPQRLAELADRGRRPDDDAPPVGIDRADARELRQVEQEPVRDHYGRERVPRPGGADAESTRRGSGDERADLVLARRRRDL